MSSLAALTLSAILLALAYFAFLERTYLRDQAAEIGDASIVRWRRGFSVIVGVLASTGAGLVLWVLLHA